MLIPGQPVTAKELDRITALVLAQEPDLDLTDLLEYYPETAGNLAVAIRSIIGLDAQAVNARFTAFAQQYKLNSTQLRFLDLLKNHIWDFGAINWTSCTKARSLPWTRTAWTESSRTNTRPRNW